MRTKSLIALACLGLCALVSEAAVVYDESLMPDLSNSGLAPTFIALASGSNQIFGNVSSVDRDYFRIQVPAGFQLAQLLLLPQTTVSGGSSFIAVQVGTQLTVDPNSGSAAGLLGFMHYSTGDIGSNLLASMSTGALAAGNYSFWLQETGGGATYGLDVVLTPVPEPGAAGLMLLGLLSSAAAMRRRRP